MPFYNFTCTACNAVTKVLLKNLKAAELYTGACTLCGVALVQTMTTPDGQGLQTVDEDRGKTLPEDTRRMVEERSDAHQAREKAKGNVPE